MKKLLLLILVTLGYANYTAAIAGKYSPPPTTFPTTIAGPVPSGGTVTSSPIALTITLDRTASPALALSNFTIPTTNATLSGLTEKVTLTYSNQFGTLGTGDGNLTKPNDIAVSAAGKIYVTDGDNNRVEIFNADGSYSTQFGAAGAGSGQFSNPYGIAFDAGGNIYVADAGNSRVQVFNSSGVYSGSIGTSGAGQLSTPQGIYIDASTNRLYVADSGNNNRIAVFDLNNGGAYLTSIGSSGNGTGQFFGPSGVVVDANHFVYVTDLGNKRVVKFDASGNGVAVIGSSGNGNGQFLSPAGIATDGTGKIYVTDKSTKSRVQVFNAANGSFLGVVGGTAGSANGSLNFPSGIGADKSGMIYVADRINNRIETFVAKEQYTASLVPTGNGPELITVSLASAVTDINGDQNAAATYSVNYTATPASPTNLLATSLDGSYELNWDANSPADDVVGYNIYEGTSANNLILLTSVDANTITYNSDIPISNGTTLYFYVTAVTSTKESAPSNIVQVTPKGNPIITAGSLPNKKYNDASIDIQPLLNPHSASNGAFTYSLDPSSVGATLTAPSTINIVGVGHVDVIITQAATNTYNSATLHVGFDITPATPVINWSPATPITYGTALDASYFTATATKAGTTSPALAGNVVYTLQPSGTHISSNSNTVLPVGDNQIRVDYTPSAPDDVNYEPASKMVTIHVGKATPILTWNIDPAGIYHYGLKPGDLPDASATDVNGAAMTNGAFTYSYSPAVAAAPNDMFAVGRQDLTATFTPSAADATNYGTAQLTKTIQIGKANQLITQNINLSKTYGDAPFSLDGLASSDSGLPVSYAVAGATYNAVTNMVTITGAGNITVTVSQAGNGNYNAATPINITITVAKATPTITWALQTTDHYGLKPGDLVQPTAVGINNTTLTGGTFTYSYSPTVTAPNDIFAVGLQSLTAYYAPSAADAVNYTNTAQLTKTIQIDQATQTITQNTTLTKTYGDAPFSIAGLASASSGLQVSYGYVSGPGTYDAATKTVTITGAGDIVVSASQGGDANYLPATPINITISVARATPAITWSLQTTDHYGLRSSDLPQPTAADINGATLTGGTFTYSYSPAAAAAPNDIFAEGSQSLTVTFTPSAADATNYGTAQLTKTIQIGKANQLITQNITLSKTYGDAPFSIAGLASSDSGLPVSYAVAGATYNAVTNMLTITGAGDITVTVSQPGNGNYNVATDLIITIPVSKATPAITWALQTSDHYGLKPGDLVQPTAVGINNTALTGGTFTYTYSPTVAAAPNDIFAVGLQSLTAYYAPSAADAANYTNTAQLTKSIQIDKSNQSITVTGTIPNKATNASPFDLTTIPVTATASSNLPVSYSIVSGPATISGTTITLTGAQGTVMVGFNQSGNNDYNPAEQRTLSFGVGKLDQSITVTGTIPDKAINAAPFDILSIPITAMASSGLQVSYSIVSGPATINGTTITLTGAPGTVTVGFNQSGNNDYNAATQEILTFGVGKLSQSITVTGTIPNKATNAVPFDLATIPVTATASSGLQVNYSIVSGPATISGTTITLTGASGTVKVGFDQAGDNTYNPADQKILSFGVGKLDQTITVAGTIPNKTTNAAPFDLTTIPVTATATSGLQVSYSIVSGPATINGTTITLTGASGTVKVGFDQAGDNTYNAAEQRTLSFGVGKLDQTITVTGTIPNKATNAAPFDILSTVAASASSNLPVSYSIVSGPATISGTTISLTGAQGTVVVGFDQAGDANYSPALQQRLSFNVGKADQTITVAGVIPDKVINSAAFDISAIPVTATASSGLPVSYSIVSGPATISGTSITLTGTTGAVTVGFNQAGNSQYNAAPQTTLTFNVNKLSQAIALTGSIPDKTYGDAPFSWKNIPVTATASSGLPVAVTISSGPATISGDLISITGAGTVTVSFSQAGNSRYDAAADQTLSFKVNQLTPQVTWTNPTSITYGTPLSNALQLYASSNIPGTFTYSPDVGTVLHAGTQTLSVTFTPTDAVNYNTVTKNVAITVNKVALNVSTNDVSRPYNQPNPDFVINYSGFANGDTQANLTTLPTASTTANVASLVGSYPITVSGAVSNDYTFRYINATLTINTTGRDLTFNQLPVKTYGDPDFDAGAVTNSGEQIIYTSSNNAVATVVNGQIHIVGAGYVTITASLPVNSNYNTTPSISQFMVVNKATQTIDFVNIPVQLRGTTYDLSNIKSSSGLPVTFTTNDPMIASINGLTVSSLRVGITGIVANQAGNANYFAANTVVRNLEVKDATREVIVHPAVSPNGDGINDVLYIEGINEHPANRVTIINRNGVRVYEINGYDNATKSFDGRSNFSGAKQQAGTYFYLVEYMVDGVGRHLTGYFVLKYD